jgi:hypothetical protein
MAQFSVEALSDLAMVGSAPSLNRKVLGVHLLVVGQK